MRVFPDKVGMKRDHRWARSRLSEYVDEELSPVERRRLERHAAVCPECGPVLRALTVTVFRLRQLRFQRSSPIAPKVIERLRAEATRR